MASGARPRRVLSGEAVAGAGALPFETSILEEVILEGVPPKVREVNQKAFAEGVARGNRGAKSF